MFGQRILSLTVCFFGAIATIMGLYFLSDVEKNNPNGFIRRLPSHLLVPVSHRDIKYNSYYIAGLTNKDVYLGSYKTPYRLKRITYDLLDTETYKLNWPNNIRVSKSALLTIDSISIFLKDGNQGRLLKSRIPFEEVAEYQTPPFTAAIIPSANSIIMRCVTKARKNVIVKQELERKTYQQNEKLLQSQVEGIF